MMIEDVRLAGFTVEDWVSDKCRQLSIGHVRMRAQRNQIIQRLDARSQEFQKQAEHRRHGHGPRAVRDDDKHALRFNWDRLGGSLDDLAQFLGIEIAIG